VKCAFYLSNVHQLLSHFSTFPSATYHFSAEHLLFIFLVKSSNGFYWSILINTYRPAENEFFTELDSLIRNTMSHPESITGRDSKP
jgi:hypothetical protein